LEIVNERVKEPEVDDEVEDFEDTDENTDIVDETEEPENDEVTDEIEDTEIIEETEDVEIVEEIENTDITNELENPSVSIEKTGIVKVLKNEEIKYNFYIKNVGNVSLSNFTWYEYLPTEYIRITKLATGTYSQNLTYKIYYKTSLSDYKLLKDNLNTEINNYIDFSNIKLKENEMITEFKVDFGTVNVGFETVVSPYVFAIVNDTVKNDDLFTNKTRIEGMNKDYLVWDEDEHSTIIYEKEIEVKKENEEETEKKKLPRTGE
jgi:hypothetical protein